LKFIPQSIPEVILIEPILFPDDRGYFSETFRQDLLEDVVGCNIDFIQENESKSNYGVLRGLHYQDAPFAQAKLVRVVSGAVLDVAVDIRKNSPTYGHYVSVELTAENKFQLYIPRGFAHGFVVLSDEATFLYKVDNYYSLDHSRGIAFDDPSLNIDWVLPISSLKLSTRDKSYPMLEII